MQWFIRTTLAVSVLCLLTHGYTMEPTRTTPDISQYEPPTNKKGPGILKRKVQLLPDTDPEVQVKVEEDKELLPDDSDAINKKAFEKPRSQRKIISAVKKGEELTPEEQKIWETMQKADKNGNARQAVLRAKVNNDEELTPEEQKTWEIIQKAKQSASAQRAATKLKVKEGEELNPQE